MSACLLELASYFFLLFLKTVSVSQIHKSLHWHWLNEASLVPIPSMYDVNLVNPDVTLKRKHVLIVKWYLYVQICKLFFEHHTEKAQTDWWWNRKNPTPWNFVNPWSLLPFPVITLVLHTWQNLFLSLVCKSWFQVRLWLVWATTLQSRMWRAAKGHRWELQGSPGGVWNHALILYKCLIFQNLAAFGAAITSRLSLSPAVLQHFYPACSFFLLIFAISSVTPFSHIRNAWRGFLTASLKCFLLLLGNSCCLPTCSVCSCYCCLVPSQ